jgi:hypothetical protein
MKKYLEELKLQAQANPLPTAAVGAALIIAISKLVNANTGRQNAKTWAREVERRRMNVR